MPSHPEHCNKSDGFESADHVEQRHRLTTNETAAWVAGRRANNRSRDVYSKATDAHVTPSASFRPGALEFT